MSPFSALHNLWEIIIIADLLKNADNPSCIDLMLTASQNYFQKIKNSFGIGLSDFD